MSRLKPVTHRFNDALSQQVPWQDFERLMARYYAMQGYTVEHVGTGEAKSQFDGGIDLKLRRGDEYVVVQCKHWNANKVPHNHVHELIGVMLTERATGAVIVTSGEFTRAAREAADAEPRIQAIDGIAVRAMLAPLLPAFVPSQNDADFHPIPVSGRTTGPASFRARRKHAAHARARNPALALAFMLIVGLVAFYAIHGAINSFAAKLSQGLAPPVVPAPSAHDARTRPAVSPQRPAQLPAPQHVVYRAHVPTTPTELEEWKRRNAESMKILEKTTPEMPLR